MKLEPEPRAKETDAAPHATPPFSTGAGGRTAELPCFDVPDHTLIRRVGKGSYGEVWLARNALGTWRAVKIVRRSAFYDDRPYEREFAGIQRFEPISRSHESQLNILQVGRADSAFYYVMEVADEMGRGQDIDPGTYTPRNLRSELHLHGRLPAADCLRIGLALTTALEHLHKHGLVHRDIKPSNIVFVNGIPKLADIGLVARAEETMSFVGTEGFLPPEGPGTRQADIYSLGKVLYELSTGYDRHQFPELPTNIADLPDRPLLGELNEVLIKACHRDPAQRYQTAAEMHVDLALLESGRSVVRLRGIERRLRFVARAGALVTAVALLAAGAFLYQRDATREAKQLAEENRVLAEQKGQLASDKSELAESNARLAEENRNRTVRLGIANGIRLLDEKNPAAALLWFVDGLTRVANHPAEEPIHRIRIQQTLNVIPRVLHVLEAEEEVYARDWSDDGQRLVTGSWDGHFRIWDVPTGQPVGAPGKLDADWIHQARFIHDGRRIFLSDLRSAGRITTGWRHQVPTNQVTVVESESGEHVFTLSGTNWALTGISRDSRWIAIADQHHVIRLHDASNGRSLAEMRGHAGAIAGLHFNRQGDLLASRAEDRTVRLWQLPSGQPAGSPLAFETPVEQMAFSPDGQLLAVARAEAADATRLTIELWEPNTGVRRERTLHIDGRLRILTFAPPESSRLWVATDKDNGVFDVTTFDRVRPPLPAKGVHSGPWTMSRNGRHVAFGAAKGFLEVWDLDSGDPVYAGNLGGRDLRRLAFSPDGSILLAERDDGAVMLVAQPWARGVATRRLTASIGEPGHRPRPGLSSDRRRFLLRRDGWFSLLDLDRLSDWEVRVPEIPHRGSGWAAIDPSGNQFAIHYLPLDPSGSHFVEVWREADNGWRRFRLSIPGEPSNFMVFSSDSSRLITMDEGLVRFWNIEEEMEERTLSCPEGRAFGMLLPGGEMALTYQQHGKGLSLLSLGDNTQIGLNLRDAVNIQGFGIAPTGDRFAFENANDSDRFVTHILSTRTGEPLTPPLDHGGTLTWVDFNPDGSRVLTAGLTPEIRVWDSSTGQQLTQLQLGNQPLRAALWSSDGRFIAARSDDRTVRAWDSGTGEAVTPILEHAGDVRYAILGPTNRLITLSQPDLLSAWELAECDLPLDVLRGYAKLVSGQYLNANGVMLALPPQELAALCRSLRERAPDLFK